MTIVPSSIWSPIVKKLVLTKMSIVRVTIPPRLGEDDGDGDGDDGGRIFTEHPSPILHAPRDSMSRKGNPSL